jgi:hypothetical protein
MEHIASGMLRVAEASSSPVLRPTVYARVGELHASTPPITAPIAA